MWPTKICLWLIWLTLKCCGTFWSNLIIFLIWGLFEAGCSFFCCKRSLTLELIGFGIRSCHLIPCFAKSKINKTSGAAHNRPPGLRSCNVNLKRRIAESHFFYAPVLDMWNVKSFQWKLGLTLPNLWPWAISEENKESSIFGSPPNHRYQIQPTQNELIDQILISWWQTTKII